MNSIWEQHSEFFELSDPQPSWMFDIQFFSENGEDTLSSIQNLMPISIDLPKYETQYVTQTFLGTERSYPINRKYSGDTNMEFYIRVIDVANSGLYEMIANLKQTQTQFAHYERDTRFNKIKVIMKDRCGNPNSQTKEEDKNKLTSYTFVNCFVTNFEIGQMSYESDEMIKCTLSWHYDFWYRNHDSNNEQLEANTGTPGGVALA